MLVKFPKKSPYCYFSHPTKLFYLFLMLDIHHGFMDYYGLENVKIIMTSSFTWCSMCQWHKLIKGWVGTMNALYKKKLWEWCHLILIRSLLRMEILLGVEVLQCRDKKVYIILFFTLQYPPLEASKNKVFSQKNLCLDGEWTKYYLSIEPPNIP